VRHRAVCGTRKRLSHQALSAVGTAKSSDMANADRRKGPMVHPMVGMEKSAPSLMPEGQRAVTVLVRV
jgi:hypothetical protein